MGHLIGGHTIFLAAYKKDELVSTSIFNKVNKGHSTGSNSFSVDLSYTILGLDYF